MAFRDHLRKLFGLDAEGDAPAPARDLSNTVYRRDVNRATWRALKARERKRKKAEQRAARIRAERAK